jgi:hypothetical protein
MSMSLETMSKRTRVWGTGGDLRRLVGTKLFQDISDYIMELSIAQGHIFSAIAFIYKTYAVGALLGGLEGECPPKELFFSHSIRGFAADRVGNREFWGRLAAPEDPFFPALSGDFVAR